MSICLPDHLDLIAAAPGGIQKLRGLILGLAFSIALLGWFLQRDPGEIPRIADHLFPALPYHNLGKAHRRLTGNLPPDAPYQATARANFFAVIAERWRAARRTAREDSAMPRWHTEPRRT